MYIKINDRKQKIIQKLKRRSTFLRICDDEQNKRKPKIICLEKFLKYSFSSSMIV